MQDLIISQATDPFRIGLLVALILTMLRTQQATGTYLPLAAGILFVAALIPLTISTGSAQPLWLQIATGVVVNAVYVAIGLVVVNLVRGSRPG